ncbi:MAG: histidine phosphatase family protein [Planctomycetota bacterium]|nr:histidine phosphatase family protein [Planctomycetota bacterium]
MSTVVLIRAGCTDYDDQHRVLGTLDMPVNQRGQEQIREIIQQLQANDVKVEVVLTSPDDPASSTAHAVAATQVGVKVKELEELKNVNQGLWQGLPESDIRKRFPRLFKEVKDTSEICPPEGETLSDACQRLERVLCKAIRKYKVFAIVAPEPLATVIRCTLQHRRPSKAACLCGEESSDLIQIIQCNTFESAGFMVGDDSSICDSVQIVGSRELS